MIGWIGVLAMGAGSCAPAPAATDSLEALYQRGTTYSAFLRAADSRREMWLRNSAKGKVDAEALRLGGRARCARNRIPDVLAELASRGYDPVMPTAESHVLDLLRVLGDPTRLRLLDSVREIVSGGAPISPQVARRMVEYFHQLKEPAKEKSAQTVAAALDLQGLTAREQEVLEKLAEGFAPKEVAAELGISWDTVRNHTTNIYTKLHVHSRAEAILKYLGRKPATER